MRHITYRARALLVIIGAIGVSSCQDLTVSNSNAPTVKEVLANPANLETSIGSTFRVFWGVTQGARSNSTYPVVQLAALGEDITSADLEVHEVAQEPRVPYDNYGAGQWTNRKPWYDLLEVITTSTEALRVLDGGLKIGAPIAGRPNGLRTDRARIFSKMMQGLGHVYHGLLFDKAFVSDEKVIADPFGTDFQPYPVVVAMGIAQLQEGIALATAAPLDTLPVSWVNGQALTTVELRRIMHSYIARAMVYSARNPTERDAVDWRKVITHLDAGITVPFSQQASTSISGTSSAYLQRTQLQTNARADNRLLGPADTSGAYQAWLALPLSQRREFVIATPDRRIHGATTASVGKYFGQPTSQTMTDTRGTYMHSRYRSIRYGTLFFNTGLIPTMTPLEMDFIRAEALFRTGDRVGAAAIINRTRVANGALKPVGINGPPAGADCVPRKESGACGDLFDALMYEKRIELHTLEAIIPFADWRGWGRLLKGSMMHFPVSGRELQTLGLPVYSFGGDLLGSAP